MREKYEKWDIEMAYGLNFSVQVKANNRDEAIAAARALIENGTTVLPFDNAVDESGLIFQGVTFAKQN